MDKQFEVKWPVGFNLLFHNLNNDLALILARCETLSRLLSENKEAENELRAIAEVAHRMVDSIRCQAA
jgi:C4-dicarboxylate-specific signal transduction histidine kinase